MPRYVVLLHETPRGYSRGPHFDLMLERGGSLQTWAVEKWPPQTSEFSAEQLPNHRVEYLDFQGEIAGDRGRVRRVAAGEYEVLEETSNSIAARLTSGASSMELTLTLADEASHRWFARIAPT